MVLYYPCSKHFFPKYSQLGNTDMSNVLIKKTIVFYRKKRNMSNYLMTPEESIELINDLTPKEAELFYKVLAMLPKKARAEELTNSSLATLLGTSTAYISKLKAGLKKKNYLVITFGTNGNGDKTAEVYIGKDQATLYNLGLRYEIEDGKAFKKLAEMFNFMDASLTAEKRQELVEEAIEYHSKNPMEFK